MVLRNSSASGVAKAAVVLRGCEALICRLPEEFYCLLIVPHHAFAPRVAMAERMLTLREAL
eukprot:CAMPEP_0180085204 /NCGR_PEP_ID=MMETSP0985-20121206/20312_1 /TAXON_ID=483367 /ORGANISM="non described non described, Strain CCMP 2436" /LENGTH=60 /DNA_ID=CAMNT_0022019001 /DNA_START=321 /DNA_END=499 /DNA_ORIENTATION=+